MDVLTSHIVTTINEKQEHTEVEMADTVRRP
jgi:hypothetical protein